MSDERRPWDQQPGEGGRAYHAFGHYLRLGSDRSAERAWRELVVVHLSDPLHGWIVAEGDVRYPDLALVHELALDVVWCNGRGELGHARVDLTTPQVDLRVDAPPAPVETWEPGAYRVAPRGVVGEWRDRRGALPPARPASLRGRVRADARVDQR